MLWLISILVKYWTLQGCFWIYKYWLWGWDYRLIAKNELLKKYNISEDEFEVADIKWEELEYIYKDFSEKRSSYEQKLAEFQKEFLMNISENGIHSIRTRVKDAEHLIVKIIRKRQENYKKYRTLDKYKSEK